MKSGFSGRRMARQGLRAALLGAASMMAMAGAAQAQAVNAGTVSASGTMNAAAAALKKTDRRLTKKQIFASGQSKAVLTRQQIQSVGPAAGAAQALSLAPGVAVRGYGGSAGTARYEFSLRGAKVGWSSVNGDAERNGITVLFDGIPMNNLTAHNGQWDSNEIPILQMISGINVINGPGNPASRWFDSIGGTVDFVPVQPTAKPDYEVGGTFGSDATYGGHFIANSGLIDGWSILLAGGYIRNDTFRVGVPGVSFHAPSESNAYFGKVTRVFDGGAISFGGYVDNNHEERPSPLFIPIAPIAGITTEGLGANAPLYSQSTSGYYSLLSPAVWFKRIQVRDYMLYGKLALDLAPDLTFHNNTWFRHGARVHYRMNNYIPGNAANTEYYYTESDTYGDQAYMDWKLPANDVKFGGYAIHQRYQPIYLGYTPSLGTNQPNPSQISNFTLYNTFLDAYIQDTITPFKGLSITPGIAGVEYQTSFYNNALGNPNNVSVTGNTQKTFTNPEPSVSVRYQPVPWGALYASYATSYQNPTDNGFGANNSNAGAVDIATLKPVKSVDYEIGAKLLFHDAGFLHNASLNINYFHDKLTNETIATYVTNFALTKFASANATLKGFNIAATADPNFHWHLFANVSFSNNIYNSYLPGGATMPLQGVPISYNPKVLASIGIDYKTFVRGILVNVGFLDQYTGSQYLFNNLTGAPSNVKQKSFNIANLSLGADIPVPQNVSRAVKVLKLAFNINNLFGTRYNPVQYISSGGYFGGNSAGTILVAPGAPRQYLVSLTAKF
ncbi:MULTISPECIES: TonB-dependent receptor [Acidiphilium]|uniref:TonB-dependent receptor n=1 Tax=Acidiphilium iwatense TaxID=768198 RepID=A0ABS9DQS4_9PROT|nr:MULTISPECIES: TonB-dependent receptor [Acidiphilium]MCF3945077.1 TonB-dependent receptor [Acidiphilium iwatense]